MNRKPFLPYKYDGALITMKARFVRKSASLKTYKKTNYVRNPTTGWILYHTDGEDGKAAGLCDSKCKDGWCKGHFSSRDDFINKYMGGVEPVDMMRHVLGEDLNVGCVLSYDDRT